MGFALGGRSYKIRTIVDFCIDLTSTHVLAIKVGGDNFIR